MHTLASQTDAAVLRAGGFRDADLFVAAFNWRGWIGWS
jgi:tRNA (cmo5U34)-methyltransferase